MSTCPLRPPHFQAKGHTQAYLRLHFLGPEYTGWQRKRELSRARSGYASALQFVGYMWSRWSHPPKEFSKFRGRFCRASECSQESAAWKDVERYVKLTENKVGGAFIFYGKLADRGIRLFMNLFVRLVIISDTGNESNALMDAVRIRIWQWQLLDRGVKEVLLSEKLSDKLQKALIVRTEKRSGPIEDCEHETSCTFVQEMEERVLIADG